jgi:fatty-acyl-CoA synthase
VGQIVVRSPTEAGGYVRPPTEAAGSVRLPTEAAGYVRPPAASGFTADGFRTGDLGCLDADGYLHVRGRAADAREIEGRTVLPLDVEDALCAVPGVRYAVALPDPAPGRRFVAAVVLAPGAETERDALARHVAEHAGAAAVPAKIAFLDRIPTTEQGKPDRAVLLERFESLD